jgi:hypothetical protein
MKRILFIPKVPLVERTLAGVMAQAKSRSAA